MKVFILLLLCFFSFSCGKSNENTPGDNEGGLDENIPDETDEDGNDDDSPSTRARKCRNKPDRSVWNDGGAEGTFVQTWNGEEWIPESMDAG